MKRGQMRGQKRSRSDGPSLGRTRALLPVALLGLATAVACSGNDRFELPRPGPGAIFAYPFDGQMDVPVGARIVVSFSDPVRADELERPCSGSGGSVQGGFCVSGPGGAISGSAMIAGAEGTIVHFESDELVPGVDYQVFVSPTILETEVPATNLPDSGPLVSFRTRQDRPRAGEDPVVWSINGQSPNNPRLPFLDFSTVRVLISEPIDPATVVLGDSIAFVEVNGGAETPVAGTLLLAGTHISFDPDDDLTPGATYRLRLTDGIRDLGGDSLIGGEYDFTPVDTGVEVSEENPTGRILQTLNTQPGVGDADFPSASRVLGDTINSIRVVSQLVGETSIDVKDANLQAVMGNPELFPDMIPLAIRKGQLIESTGLDVLLGGAIPANLQTGDVTVRFISDATGFVMRNPLRPADVNPDDFQSPLFVYLAFDAAVSAVDQTGNSVLNQPLLDVQVAGVALVKEGALVIETAGSMELDLLGVAKAPANLVLAMATTSPDAVAPTDSAAPTVTASYPFDGQDDFAVTDSIVLVFSEPVEADAAAGDVILTSFDVPVEILVQSSGSSLVITPRQKLFYDREYVLQVGSVRDVAGNPLSQNVGDALEGDGTLIFNTPVLSNGNQSPPLLTSLYPGVPCALVGATAESPGRCAGGEDTDSLYRPFTMPANGRALATFDKPMNLDSMNLGLTCGDGSIRLEALDDGGICEGAVPATLVKRERSFELIPNDYLEVGKTYRYVLGTGTNSSCNTGELCGANNQPLNPDPLDGGEDGDGGGPSPTIEYLFTATPVSEDTFVPAIALPFTDLNGSGLIEGGEVRRHENRAAMRIVDSSGLGGVPDFDEPDCVEATPELENCIFVAAAMPVSMGATESNCTVGNDDDGNPIIVDTCIPARIYPQVIYTTSMSMDLIFGISLSTQRTVMRVREPADGPAYGYVFEDPQTGSPVLLASLDAYMDAPDMALSGSHDLHSKPLTIEIRGPIAFAEDGRMKISAANVRDIEVVMNLDIFGLGIGSMTLQIPAGEMKLQLMSGPSKGVRR